MIVCLLNVPKCSYYYFRPLGYYYFIPLYYYFVSSGHRTFYILCFFKYISIGNGFGANSPEKTKMLWIIREIRHLVEILDSEKGGIGLVLIRFFHKRMLPKFKICVLTNKRRIVLRLYGFMAKINGCFISNGFQTKRTMRGLLKS